MATSFPDSFGQWHLGDVQATARGQKFASLTADGQPVQFHLTPVTEPLSTPWGAGSYDRDERTPARLSIEFNAPPWLAQRLEALDAWTVEYVTEHSERLFKKRLSPDTVRENYKPSLTRRGSYPPTVRCKVALKGPHPTKLWGQGLEQVPEPEDWKASLYVPRVHISQLWLMGTTFGWQFQITDLLVVSQGERRNPFAAELADTAAASAPAPP